MSVHENQPQETRRYLLYFLPKAHPYAAKNPLCCRKTRPTFLVHPCRPVWAGRACVWAARAFARVLLGRLAKLVAVRPLWPAGYGGCLQHRPAFFELHLQRESNRFGQFAPGLADLCPADALAVRGGIVACSGTGMAPPYRQSGLGGHAFPGVSRIHPALDRCDLWAGVLAVGRGPVLHCAHLTAVRASACLMGSALGWNAAGAGDGSVYHVFHRILLRAGTASPCSDVASCRESLRRGAVFSTLRVVEAPGPRAARVAAIPAADDRLRYLACLARV